MNRTGASGAHFKRGAFASTFVVCMAAMVLMTTNTEAAGTADLVIPHSKKASTGPEISLGQPWAKTRDPQFRPASVRFTWTPKALRVEAYLIDNDPVTKATKHNQRLWELGDVFEVFLKMAGSKSYVELHVAPNNIKAHISYPFGVISEDPRNPEFEDLLKPVNFPSRVTKTQSGWQVSLRVPASILGQKHFHQGDTILFSFCRYDAGNTRPPVLSTSSPHPIVAFHRPEEWKKALLGK